MVLERKMVGLTPLVSKAAKLQVTLRRMELNLGQLSFVGVWGRDSKAKLL
jgi:hypothetical protein